MLANYIITGRIRDEKNLAVEGYTVQAFDKDPNIYLKPDDGLGSAITDRDGSFKIVFNEEVFKDWLEGGPFTGMRSSGYSDTTASRCQNRERKRRIMSPDGIRQFFLNECNAHLSKPKELKEFD